LLFPIEWQEPFGLVMIEAMACGTPIVAFRSGSVPEVMKEGVTGFVVSDLDEAVSAVGRVAGLSRRAVRQVFEERYQVSNMAKAYTAIYRRMMAGAPAREHLYAQRPKPAPLACGALCPQIG
jgi:glycosyltransferase involved in cell wall biosynthesis